MSRYEKNLQVIIKLLKLPYDYVGDGSFMIGTYCPDFIRRKGKAIIEFYGSHHFRKSNMEHDQKRNAFIRKQGYKMLILDDLRDLGSVVKKIMTFEIKILRNMQTLSNER